MAVAHHVLVSGRVQGVAFRWYARERARELGLAGWIRNLSDGRVEAWIEGGEAPAGEMLSWLREGPPSARVRRVEARDEAPRGLEGFAVRHDGP